MRRAGPLIMVVSIHCIGCDPPPLTSTGVVQVFGEMGMGPGAFSYPRAITVSADGTLFIVDKTARIQRFDADGVFETSWRMPEWEAGKPVGLYVHSDDRVFVADTHYHRVVVYDRDGNEVGRFGEEGSGPGQFGLPTDVAVDAKGFIYVSEYGGNDRITKWSADLQFVSVLVTGEVAGQPLRRPAALIIDGEQTLWIADACNHRIVRLDLQGKVLTVFGELGKEPGQLRYPYDIDVDVGGNVLVCEYGNCRLQWFDSAGRSLRVWGEPGREIGQLNSPWGANRGRDGRIYVLDSLNARVQVIRP